MKFALYTNNQQIQINRTVMKNSKSNKDKSIATMFDGSYRSEAKPADFESFDESAKLHVKYILENKSKSVLDVGMGAGGIMMVLQDKGVERLIGVELSHEGIDLAKRRFEAFGDISKVSFFEGSYLDFPPETVDAVSLHQVLHCHPDFQAMIKKTLESAPKIIINTMPRRTWYMMLFLGIVSTFTILVSKGFRAYVHSPDEVKDILSEFGYERVSIEKSFIWETSLFRSKQNIEM